jgi:ribosomal protein L7/L12
MANNEQANVAFSNEVIQALKNGRKIEAIKLLRNETGLGLKEAKELVENYIDEHTEIKEAFQANKMNGLSQENMLRMGIIMIVLIVLYMIV